MNYRKAQINWEAFDNLKISQGGEHLCTLHDQQDFTGSGSENSSLSGSTNSLLDEVNDFLQVAKTKLVTVQDWEQIRAKKIDAKKLDAKQISRTKNYEDDLEY